MGERDIFDEIFREIRRRLMSLEEDVRSILGPAPKDDIDEEAIEPLSTVHETADAVIVTVDMPLVQQDSIEAKLIDDEHLLVRGEISRRIASAKIDSTYPTMEFRRYKKVITLPARVRKIGRISVRGDVITIYLRKY